MTTNIAEQNHIIEIPLGISSWDIADRFANAQPNPAKAEQVRRNTLAVLAVRDYLTWHEIETNIITSDCWNPAVRMMEDVADLVLPGLGRVECRPVLPGEAICELPMETLTERMGYFWVELDLDTSVARLVGFAEPTFDEDVLEVILEREHLSHLDQFHAFLSRREKIAALINSTYTSLIPEEEERLTLETEWTWITLKFPPFQWKLRAKQATEKYEEEIMSMRETALGSTGSDTESWDDLLQDFFDDLSDELDLE